MEHSNQTTQSGITIPRLGENNRELYLRPTWFVEADHPGVSAFIKTQVKAGKTPKEWAVNLYYAVRDAFRYNPYMEDYQPESFRTSHILDRNYQRGAHCIDKANVMIASARSLGIPSRFFFYNVRNHIGTEKLEKVLGTDVMVFHGCVELWLENRWVKATPAFNVELCKYLGVAPLDFNGEEDSIFQEFDASRGQFMEYVHEYGAFHDLPYEFMVGEWIRYYPNLSEKMLKELMKRETKKSL